jgi:3-hydroxyacyl-CoA dehydrogenase
MKSPVQKLGVVGANRYSVPLVRWVLSRGYPVVWLDRDFGALENHLDLLKKGFASDVKAGLVTPLLEDSQLQLLSATTQTIDLSGCNLVVETTPDGLEEKIAVAKELESVLGPETGIGVSLDTLTVTQLGSYLLHPERLFGIRPIGLPPRSLAGFEILSGLETGSSVVEAAADFARMLELYPALAKEGPGGIANRLLARCFSEARAATSEDGAMLSALDEELMKRGFETVPGATIDKVGRKWASRLTGFFHRFYGNTFLQLRAESRDRMDFSVKAGEGVSRTASDGAGHLILSLVNECIQIVYDGVASWDTVNRVSVLTFGLEGEREGLLEWGHSKGWPVVLTGLWEVSVQTGGRVWPSPLLQLKGVSNRKQPGAGGGNGAPEVT